MKSLQLCMSGRCYRLEQRVAPAVPPLSYSATDNSQPGKEVRISIEKCFYVDNCLQIVPTIAEAWNLVDKLRALLASAGFELRQWASNEPKVISNLPEDSRSASVELWLAQNKSDAPESTPGLS